MTKSRAMSIVVGGLITICALCMGLFFVGLAAGMAHASGPFTGRVVGVADGDTLTVLVESSQHKVRLAEIDAPEKRQAFGERAKLSLSALCFSQQAEVSPGVTDRYGRTVARVRCNGVDASLYQVSHGLAWAYTLYLKDPAIAAAEAEARAAGTGLWIDAVPTPPWTYRKGSRP